MESSSKPVRKRKAPERYTPDVEANDLIDDLSVDSNWENDNIYSNAELAATPKDDYEKDSFLVSDDDSLEFDTDGVEESEDEYSDSEDSETSFPAETIGSDADDTESTQVIEEVEDNVTTSQETNMESYNNKEHTS